MEAGPQPWRDGVVRWRLIDLAQWLWEAFRVSVSVGSEAAGDCETLAADFLPFSSKKLKSAMRL